MPSILIFILTFGFIVGPFFIWDPKAYIDSTINYLSGSIEHSYPISGYGFGMLLNQIGIINNLKSYYPFIVWQIIFGLPLMIYFIILMVKNVNVKKLILFYGIFLFVYWYFSRYFNNSHFGYLSLVFLTSYFWPQKDEIWPQKDEG